ncbi:MAG: [protein-PII] uridylyltransferase [Desulfuromonadaceae bacterium]|nr:[protein-PII] uridylyltransferase [Desulfuromonadaceae bacterium]
MNIADLLGDVFSENCPCGGGTATFEKRRTRILAEYNRRLEFCRERIQAWHRAGGGGREVVRALTETTDTLLRALLMEVSPGRQERDKASGLALIAIGGYGRGELNPRSDIDLMFCHDSRNRETALVIAERMLYLLWDMGLDVASCVRTCEDCLELSRQDLTIRTSLLDSRFLDGDPLHFRYYEKKVMEPIRRFDGAGFIRDKLAESEARQRKYGSSVYLLEPNIKEGKGGLRELHTALWVAKVKYKIRSGNELVHKGIVSETELADIEGAFDYLWHIRNELHYLLRRKSDQIQFAHQERIAHFLGYRDQKHALAVEQFMKDYYTRAAHVVDITSALVAKATDLADPPKTLFGLRRPRHLDEHFYVLHGVLRTSRPEAFSGNPLLMLQAFRHSQHQDVELSFQLQEIIRDHVAQINDRGRRSREMGRLFLDILRAPRGVAKILREMHRLHFLHHFIPEFGGIFCMVQHDAYHIYTVDIHSLFSVEELVRLWRGEYAEQQPLLTEVAGQIEKRELLLLAALLHDVGKGEGSGHAEKGAEMIPTIARRLGLGREDAQRLEFLVRNHLLMAHIAQRRDLNDEKMIHDFAGLMGMSENLKMLYLLTFADLKAVGPDVWTPWKGLLLSELYRKTFSVLEKGNFPHEKRSEKVQHRKRQVVEMLADEFGERSVREELKQLETRYFLEHGAGEIGNHLRVLFSRGERSLAMRADPVPGTNHTRLIISTLDVPGLFSKIAGVLAAGRINILGAQIYTLKNGVALDILQVDGGNGRPVSNPEKWARIEKRLATVIEGREQVDALVAKSRAAAACCPLLPPRRHPDRVEIDNEVSEHYTVLDVYTRDRVGLLYDITRTLSEMNLTIGVSKISTKVDQVADTFYVKDIFGSKITQAEKLAELEKRVLAAVGYDHDS